MLTVERYALGTPQYLQIVFEEMRNSWESWEKGDSTIDADGFVLGNADRELALKLTRAGADHGKYLRQIPIIATIVAPNYVWVEIDTYKIGTTRNSTSKMHTLGKHEFTADMFSFEDMPADIVEQTIYNLNQLRLRWITEAAKRKGPQATVWRGMVQAIPDSWNYRSGWSANYQVLRNIYFARRNHRLAEWRTFCTWIEQLPHSELLTDE